MICANVLVLVTVLIYALFLVNAAATLDEAHCRLLRVLQGLSDGDAITMTTLQRTGMRQAGLSLNRLAATARHASNGSLVLLEQGIIVAGLLSVQLDAAVQLQQWFQERKVWQEHRCLFCEEAAYYLAEYREDLLEGVMSRVVASHTAAALAVSEASSLALRALDSANSATILSNWLEQTVAVVEARWAGALRLTQWIPFFAGIFVAVSVSLSAAVMIVSWRLKAELPAIEVSYTFTNHRVPQDPSRAERLPPPIHAWTDRSVIYHSPKPAAYPRSDEEVADEHLARGTMRVWHAAGLGAVLAAFTCAACIICIAFLRLGTAGAPGGSFGLRQLLMAEASRVDNVSNSTRAQEALAICLQGNGSLHTQWPRFSKGTAILAGSIATAGAFKSVNPFALAPLVVEADVRHGLSGSRFVHFDQTGLLPAKLRSSSASRSGPSLAQAEALPGMWLYAEELNRIVPSLPPWVFSSIDEFPTSCMPSNQSNVLPCRRITDDDPSEAEALRDLGGQSVAHIFHVARMKERVWHHTINGTNTTLHIRARQQLVDLSASHAQLVNLAGEVGPPIALQLPILWQEPLSLERRLHDAGDCSWAKAEALEVDRQLVQVVSAVFASALAALGAVVGFASLACFSYRQWLSALRCADVKLLHATRKCSLEARGIVASDGVLSF